MPKKENGQTKNTGRGRKMLSGGKKALIVICCLLALLLAGGAVGAGYVKSLLGNASREPLNEADLGITAPAEPAVTGETTAPAKQQEVLNIALFGVDTRDMSETVGRSDAILVLTIDKPHQKIKLTTIERDSYVMVEGYGWTKLTHAYVYGGHQLAVKTLNQNYGLDIQDYVAVNFSQLAAIIDYIGGVRINVTEAEAKVMEGYIRELNQIGVETEPLSGTGDLLLSGGQAVAYARNRYTGSDQARMDRQYEVLLAMVVSVKQMNMSQYPDLVRMILSQCVTSLSDSEMVSMGLWALGAKPQFCRLSLPDEACNAHGEIIDELWYNVYDLSAAAEQLHKFIYEE